MICWNFNSTQDKSQHSLEEDNIIWTLIHNAQHAIKVIIHDKKCPIINKIVNRNRRRDDSELSGKGFKNWILYKIEDKMNVKLIISKENCDL